jgi:hypothetical protein
MHLATVEGVFQSLSATMSATPDGDEEQNINPLRNELCRSAWSSAATSSGLK